MAVRSTFTPDVLRCALPERYRVTGDIGRCGMATVFLASDLEHDRSVAIKVLHPAYARVVGRERFHREIALLTRLHHSNILPLLDSGEAGELPYYVMPHASGGSLRAVVERSGPLSLADVLAITRDVAAAIDYAHAQHVIHRDIKPENIVFEQGHALVCDFGIARAIETAGGEGLSSSGLIVGTPTYMSPEQAGGARDVGVACDIYALGCVVYEMLVGEPPFTGATVQAILARHVAERPPSLRVVRPDVPRHIEEAVHAALAKRPEDRPPSGAALELWLMGGKANGGAR
jgi:serine/threonine protein kinase